MKLRIIPLFISCCILLTSMSECQKNNLVHHTVENPVSCTIDNVTYESSPEKILNIGGDAHRLLEYDWGFTFNINRCVSSDMGSYRLYLNVVCKEPFELNKRYPVVLNGEDKTLDPSSLLDNSTNASNWIYHNAISGWVEFTDFSKGHHCYVSGIFEMECIDSDDSPIILRNGQFGPVRVYYDNNKE